MGLISKIKKSFEIVEELKENRIRLLFATSELKCKYPKQCGAGEICNNCFLIFFFKKLDKELGEEGQGE